MSVVIKQWSNDMRVKSVVTFTYILNKNPVLLYKNQLSLYFQEGNAAILLRVWALEPASLALNLRKIGKNLVCALISSYEK